MIKFQYRQLNTLTKVIKNIGNRATQEARTPHAHVKLTQVEEKITQLTTYEPHRAIFTRNIIHDQKNGGGEPGQEWLIYIPDLLNILALVNKAKIRTIALDYQNGRIHLQAVEDKHKSLRELRPYRGGIESDFAPPELTQAEAHECTAEIKGDAFLQWVSSIDKFGAFNDRFDGLSLGRIVLCIIDSKSSSLAGITYPTGTNNAYIRFASPLDKTPEPLEFCIEGRQLPRLKDISTNTDQDIVRINIQSTTGWVTFSGTLGSTSVVLPGKEVRYNLSRYNLLFQEDRPFQFISSRTYELDNLRKACILQTSTNKLELSTDLLFTEDHKDKDGDHPELIIVAAKNITTSECSYISSTVETGEWKPIIVSHRGVSSILNLLDSTVSSIKHLCLSQYKFRRQDNTDVWILYFKLKDNHERCICAMTVRLAEEGLDLLDVEE